jgi:hypothetical protein
MGSGWPGWVSSKPCWLASRISVTAWRVASRGVGCGRDGLYQGLELGFEEFAFLVEFGEPGADPCSVGLGGGVVRVGGQVV